MPGLDYPSQTATVSAPAASVEAPRAGVYYNARLDPKNFLEGPFSHNAATRLRQMLARPGIVVSTLMNFDVAVLLTILQCAPGICDGISARVALEAGFDCLYQR